MKSQKKLICMFLLVSMFLSMVPIVSAAPASEDIITTPTGYSSAQDVDYTEVDGYIVNWGARGEDCSFLSINAQNYYTGDYRYSVLSELSGGTSTATAPESALYLALQSMMQSNHTTYTTYGGSSSVDCKNFYCFTDCMANDTSTVSTLYRGLTVSGVWDSGTSYNQEHMWPKSKCLTTQEIGDIMHLRAANPSENSSRGNTAYGESESYYDPGVSVRGDCARTVLYNYVRWGNTGNMWGTAGVMESLDVLLKWMEADPVDTWEMGRNDAVESITGVRNVFVDYPEYAWLLFGVTVPDELVTPSGFDSTEDAPGDSSTIATLVTDAASLQAGDQIIIAAVDYDYAISTTQNSNNRGQAAVTKYPADNILTYTADTQVLTLEYGTTAGMFALSAGENQYLCAASSSGNYLRTADALTDQASWTISIDEATGIASITAGGTYTRNVLRYNATSGLFACYSATNSQKDICIYLVSQNQGTVSCKHLQHNTAGICISCGQMIGHSYEAAVTAPSCTEDGYTTYSCACGDTYTADVTPAAGHNYEYGICTSCGAKDPSYESTTNTATLVTDVTSLQVGDQILIVATGYDYAMSTVQNTNNRGQTAVAKTSDGRIVTFDNTAQIITLGSGTATGSFSFIVGDGQYLYASSSSSNQLKTATALSDNASWSISIDSNTGIAAINAAGTYTRNVMRYNTSAGLFSCYAATNSQKDITIYRIGEAQEHGHSYTATVTAPTCTEAGYTTYTCSCGHSYTGNPVAATGHSYVNGYCINCGEKDSNEGETDPIVAPTLTGSSFSLSFESEILVNFYYTVSDTTDVVEQGMLVFYSNPTSADITKADDIYTGSVSNNGVFLNTTKGIAAKYMGDTRYYAAYAKLSDGTFAYSKLYSYSPKKYATNMLSKSSTSAAQKALCVAMLNYGAAAQNFFGYRTDDLMNASLTAEQQALVTAYDASLFKGAVAADASKTGNFTKNADAFSMRSATVSFEGAFAINYYFAPSNTIVGDMTLYYWTPADYAAASKLSTANATGTMTMVASGDGSYWGQVSGIAAKYLDETYYVAGVYKDASGNTYCTGVIAYSLSKYCMNNAKPGKDMQELAANTAMYGYYASAYFN